MLLPRSSRADEHRRVMDSLRRIVRALRLSSTDLERTHGVSVAQHFVLEQLADGQPRSIRELARETLTDPSSVSVVVARLVEHKLVTRRADASDGRRARVALTNGGRTLLSRAPEPIQARLLASLRRLPARRVRELAATLDVLAAATGTGDAELFFERAHKRVAAKRRRSR
jgi:DNA-binding MarR family transcriptional regulator